MSRPENAEQATNSIEQEEKESLGQKICDEVHSRLKTMKSTEYGHSFPITLKSGRQTTTYFYEKNDEYKYDCVGFVSRVLHTVAPRHKETVFTFSDTKNGFVPTTDKYYHFFNYIRYAKCEGWKYIDNIHSIQRGDIIVWLPPTPKGQGHIVIALSKPEKMEDLNPKDLKKNSDIKWYKLHIADSTSSKHTNDSRKNNPKAIKETGMGTGWIAICDVNNRTWLAWGATTKSINAKLYGPAAIARVEHVKK